jgi:DNA polymerase IV (DinB-like DNA polymerase)
MPIIRAQKLLQAEPSAVFLPVDHAFYEEISGRVMQILRTYADRFEQMSVDEAYVDVTRRADGLLMRAVELAQQLKAQMRRDEYLSCSVGVAPNKLLAKMAADAQKPDGLTVITPDQAEAFLAPLPLERLYGIGPKSAERLRGLGVSTVGQLAATDVTLLIRTFGPEFGRSVHRAAQGLDDEPVGGSESREQISRIVTLRANTRDRTAILPVLEELARDVHAEAKSAGLAFRTVSVLAFMEDLSMRTRDATLERATSELAPLLTLGRTLLGTLLDEVSDLDVRRVGLRVGRLTPALRERALTEFVESS